VNARDKFPKIKQQPTGAKEPRITSNPEGFYDARPSWRIYKLEMCKPYGWHEIDRAVFDRIKDRLIAFESMTWREILIDGKKRHHSVKTDLICKDARQRLAELQLDDYDRLLSLSLSGRERIWGIFSQGVLGILWWDPNHEVCPSLLKNT
jgi:hypothetical protein